MFKTIHRTNEIAQFTSYFQAEQKLAIALSERQVSQLVEDDEVHSGQMLSKRALPSVTGLGLEPIDEVATL